MRTKSQYTLYTKTIWSPHFRRMNCVKRFRILHRSRSTFSGSFNRKHNYVHVCSLTTCRLTHFCIHQMAIELPSPFRFSYFSLLKPILHTTERERERGTNNSLIEIEAVDRKHAFFIFFAIFVGQQMQSTPKHSLHFSGKYLLLKSKMPLANITSTLAHSAQHTDDDDELLRRWHTARQIEMRRRRSRKNRKHFFFVSFVLNSLLTQSLEKWSIDSIWHVA